MEITLSIPMLDYNIQLARVIYNILKRAELTQNLSGEMRDHLHTCQQCCLSIIRICNSYKVLITAKNQTPVTSPVNFNVCELVQGLLDAFSETLSTYCDIDIRFQPKINPYTSICIDQKLFEITVLNILYLFVRNRVPGSSAPLKLTVYVNETRDDITLHIRSRKPDKKPTRTTKHKAQLNSVMNSLLRFDEEGFTELSLDLAKWAATSAHGRLEWETLKDSIRYDITLPKFSGNTNILGATIPYRKSDELYLETFSEFNLVSELEKVEGLLSFVEDLKLW